MKIILSGGPHNGLVIETLDNHTESEYRTQAMKTTDAYRPANKINYVYFRWKPTKCFRNGMQIYEFCGLSEDKGE